jgi:hypothetical protein
MLMERVFQRNFASTCRFEEGIAVVICHFEDHAKLEAHDPMWVEAVVCFRRMWVTLVFGGWVVRAMLWMA